MENSCTKSGSEARRSIELPVLPNSGKKHTEIAHSRSSNWRAAVLIGVNLFIIAHIIQWRLTGSTVSPVEPSESMYTLQNGYVNAGFIFFSVALLLTVIFGRFFCGWACHIVALQDFCAWLLQKVGLKPRPFRSRLLVYIPLITALYMFVWPTVSRYITKPPSEPLFPEFTNHLITTEFWATFPPVWIAIPFLFICGFVVVYFLGSKGFCTYGCPYGGFFAELDKLSPGKIRVTDACEGCGHCTAVCTSNVIVHAEVKQYGMVVDPGCMKCMDCVSVCPNDALYFGFGKPAVGVKKTLRSNHSLTWPEEIAGAVIFIAAYFAVWNVYQIIPMLMAIGIAIVTTFLALRAWRLLGQKDQAFYGRSLRIGGKLTVAGYAFLAVAFAWVGWNAHSGFVRYNESQGTAAYERLTLPDELALAQADPAQWLSAAEQANINSGKRYLERATRYGLFTNVDALPKLAWMEHLSGNTDEAVRLLGVAANHQSGQSLALSHYYRGAMLNRQGNHAEALTELDLAIKERPDLGTAREEKGEALWQLGRHREAVDVWTASVDAGMQLPLTYHFLTGAFAAMNDADKASAFESQALQITPKDPYFFWMVGLRLKNVGMDELAEKNFNAAVRLDPAFGLRRNRLRNSK